MTSRVLPRGITTALPISRISNGGQAIVEYAIVFPIQLMLTLCIIQLGHLFVAKQVVEYAAFCAARAALVGEDPQDAASFACTRITGWAGVNPGAIYLPGWGDLPGYGAARSKTRVRILPPGPNDPQPPPVSVEVVHNYQLRVPIADWIVYRLGDVLVSYPDADRTYGEPHIPISGTCTLASPFAPN